jgi:hypothetical protein
MLIAVMHQKDGRKVLVIGLMDENIERLRNDKPIYKALDAVIEELPGWDLTVLGPEDMHRFIAHFGEKPQ